ncbi:MAG: hypothetical protein IAG13_16040, partial [Deltaproteobacteria bacterium]|nr:hypothetical protein [Nannocystaceae bacterium]
MGTAAILRLLLDLVAPSALLDGRVSVGAVGTVAPGSAVELSVTILDTPMAGLPLELWLWSADIALFDNRFDGRDVVDPQARQPRIRARVVAPREPGRYGVGGHVVYVSCGE